MSLPTRNGLLAPALLSTLVALHVAACDDSARSLHLDRGEESDAGEGAPADDHQDDDSEARRELLDKKMAVRASFVNDGTCSPACATGESCYEEVCYSKGTPVEIDDLWLRQRIADECRATLQQTKPEWFGGTIATATCYKGHAATQMCGLHRMLEVAGLRAEPLAINIPADGDDPAVSIKIPVQSTAANVTLAMRVQADAREQAGFYLARIRWMTAEISNRIGDAAISIDCNNNYSLLPETALSLIEVRDLYHDATDIAIENTLASSDAAFGSVPSTAEAAREAVAEERLSRAAAAHMIVGGDPGLLGSTEKALCDQARLTPQAQRAVSAFRLAAVSPSDLLNASISTQFLVEGTNLGGPPSPCSGMLVNNCCDYSLGDCRGSALTESGSVRQRLDELQGTGSIAQLEMLGVGTGAAGILGLRMEDFETARSYLKQEIKLYNRTKTAILPALPRIGGGTTAYPRFAGVATTAPARPDIYWAALASWDNNAVNVLGSSTTNPGNRYMFYSHVLPYTTYFFERIAVEEGTVEDFYDYENGQAEPGLLQFDYVLYHQIEEAIRDGGDNPHAMEMSKILAPMLAEGRSRLSGASVVRFTRLADHQLEIRMENEFAGAQYEPRIAFGDDALECAVTGTIEGSPCSQARLDALTLPLFAPLRSGLTQSGTRFTYTSTESHLESVLSESTSRVYVLAKMNGKYKPIAFMYTSLDASATVKEQHFSPIIPDLFAKVADVLKPSPDWCARPAVSCAGERFDARMPLENELSDDGDGVESSWRHYLQLAQQASAESDLLAGEVMGLTESVLLRDEAQALAQLQRAEPAIEELHRICGSEVDPTDVLRAFSSDGTKDYAALRGPTCSGPTTCSYSPARAASSGIPASSARTGNCYDGTCILNCNTSTPCPPLHVCSGGTCAWDPMLLIGEPVAAQELGASSTLNVSNANRLAECLSDNRVVDVAAIGNRSLCYWVNSNDNNRICNGATAESPCPLLVSEPDGPLTDSQLASHCSSAMSMRPAATDVKFVPSRHALGIFSAQTDVPLDKLECSKIRRLRASPGGNAEEVLANLKQSGLLHPDNLASTVQNLGWEARYGSYSAITMNGAPVFTTGSPALGPGGGTWPCGSVSSECGFSQEAGLFCSAIDCSNVTMRAQTNERMLRAALAAVDAAGGSLKNFKLPVQYLAAKQSATSVFIDDGVNTVTLTGENIVDACLLSDTSCERMSELERYQGHSTNEPYALPGVGAPLINYLLEKDEACTENGHGYSCATASKPDNAYQIASISAADLAWQTATGVPFFDREDRGGAIWYFGIDTPEAFTFPIVGKHAPATVASHYLPYEGTSQWMANSSIGWIVDYTNLEKEIDRRYVDFSPAKAMFMGLSNASDNDPAFGDVASNDSDRRWFLRALQGEPVVAKGEGRALPSNALMARWYRVEGYGGRLGDVARHSILPPYEPSKESYLDALELLCELHERQEIDCAEKPPEVASVEDFDIARAYVRCLAAKVRLEGSKLMLPRLPMPVLEAATAQGGQLGTFPSVGGSYGVKLNELATAIQSLADLIPDLADTMLNLEESMQHAENEVRQAASRQDLEKVHARMSSIMRDLQLAQAAIGAVGGIAGGIAGLAGGDPSKLVGGATATADLAAIALANAQLENAQDKALDIQAQMAQLQISDTMLSLASAVGDSSYRLHQVAAQVRESVGHMSTALAEIESERDAAKRAFYRATLMDTDVMKEQFEATSFMRMRLNLARVRYEEAQRNARRMAFLARRAIEQRLGVDLASVTTPLPLVAAPSTWVDTVCATSGGNLENWQEQLGENFGEVFIGAYVDRLANVVESYRLVNSFHEGSDTAVLSVRDDLLGIREPCSTPVNNLLYHSGDLRNEVWTPLGCPAAEAADAEPGELRVGASCISISELQGEAPEEPLVGDPDDQEGPFPASWPEHGRAAGYRITFGDAQAALETDGDCDQTDTCRIGPATRIAQLVDLPVGRYRLSWLARAIRRPTGVGAETEPSADPAGAVRALISIPSGVENVPPTYVEPPNYSEVESIFDSDDYEWERYFYLFDITDGEESVAISIAPQLEPGLPVSQQVDIAALMLEDISELGLVDLDQSPLPGPRPYLNTGEELEAELPVCEDTDGSTFRADRWQRRCMKLCSDGLRDNCVTSGAIEHCFWETVFSISQRDVESGRQAVLGGFARGNFNYRIDSLALNFVGTGTRNCEDSPTPSTCFAAGFVPYTMLHLGPYYIRTYDGRDYKTQLFTGRIEHARGLAAERYLTNPISSADSGLITPYLRSELKGRPLDGSFALRIWEEPGVEFNGIEDIQLILSYRYWTRFN